MPTLKFRLEGRRAYLDNDRYLDKFKSLLSYASPTFRFTPAYRAYMAARAEGELDEYLANGGWDGRVSMVKYESVPIGLLIGAQKEIRDAGFKIKLIGWKNRPRVAFKKGFKEHSRDYKFQNRAVKCMLRCLSKGGGTVLSATGSGKTKATAQFFSWVNAECVFVVDQVNLLYQAQKELSYWLKERVGIVGNSKFQPARITVATIQTLAAHKDRPHFKKWVKGQEVVVIDELHKQLARRNFQIINFIKPAAVIGLTATLQMRKKQVRWRVFSVAGPVVYEFPVEKGIRKGVLAQGSVVQVEVPEESDPVQATFIDNLKDARAREYLQQVVYHRHIFSLIKHLVEEGHKRKLSVVVLADRIAHVKLLARKLAMSEPCVVRGAVKEQERQRIIKLFERGQENLIVASSVFTKGVNIKRISLIIDAAQRKSPNDALQKLGRGLRKHEDKDFLRYVDICTMPSMKKEGSRRRNAFKKARIPTMVTKSTSAKEILDLCEKQIKKAA